MISRIVSTNAFVILATSAIYVIIIPPWWLGMLIGALCGVVSCLLTDLIEAVIRIVIRGRASR